MYNTTTIPTEIIPTNSFLDVMMVISLGLLFGASMVEFGLHRLREHAEDEGAGEEEVEKEKSDDEEKYKALVRRPLSDAELTALGTKCVRETVEMGDGEESVVVLLSYDKKTEAFWYYTDHLKEVSYPMLETIARKFAIEYDCKSICVEPTACVPTASEPTASEPTACEPTACEPTACEPTACEPTACEPTACEPTACEPATVFAKFKNYNTGGKGAKPNFNATTNTLEQTNHFRFRGKLADYNEQQLKQTILEPTLDYATYKKLLEKKDN